ncbi:hypothetical protein [Dactylosporangium darangshiense]|uniref:ATP/GTP-binding protein n=1 Tax=Dactylosporangium darangshiense TaxID=579108 RepID=A0ABP8DRY6_9ACTN
MNSPDPRETDAPHEPAGGPTPVPIPAPVMPPSAGARLPSVRIGIWGGTASGKTTFLAALPIAVANDPATYGTWRVSGTTEEATRFLLDGVDTLTRQRQFPNATLAPARLAWSFHGETIEPGRGPSLLRRRPRRRESEFVLEIQDAPGVAYSQNRVAPDVVDFLAEANGILYLFDPLAGDAATDNFQYFYGVLQMLVARTAAVGKLERGRLPQHVAVCVTKFDDPVIFNNAVRAGFVTQDADGGRLPKVPDTHAQAYFDWTCQNHRHSGAPLVREALRTFFLAERVSYFATSAIGFHLNWSDTFDFRDFINIEHVEGRPRVRGLARPINVIEPLVTLERGIRGRLGRDARN